MQSQAPEGASTLELFFDLVFVFALTQVSAFLVEHSDAGGLARCGAGIGQLELDQLA